MDILRIIIHYGLHLLFPGLLASVFFKATWKKAWGLMLLTMLIDLDHLMAEPIFDPFRCSIGFHPLHSYYVIPLYLVLLFPKKTRAIGLGLVLHMITDALDCLWIT